MPPESWGLGGDAAESIAVIVITLPLLPGLTELQSAGAHLAVVVDEYGGLAGWLVQRVQVSTIEATDAEVISGA